MRLGATVLVAALVIAACGSSATTSSPTGTAAAPTTPGVPDLPNEGPVTAGTYRLGLPGVVLEVPDTWSTCCGGVIVKNDFAGILASAATVVTVYGNSCTWKSASQAKVTGAAAMAAALAAVPGRAGTTPKDIHVGAMPGVHVRVSVPMNQPVTGPNAENNFVFTGCDDGEYRSFTGDLDGARYHQAPGQIDDFYLVDRGEELYIIDVVTGPSTSAADAADLAAMLESIQVR